MLIASLLPLLSRYSLAFDLIAGPDDIVTLTVIPRKAVGDSQKLEASESRPISLTASAAEIDAELARGADGALGQLIATRRTLGDQIADQRASAEAARTVAAQAARPKAVARPTAPAHSAKPAVASNPPDGARADEPATLF